jgi:hypothetical protein
MDIIQKTGIPTKNKGDGLSSSDVNKINSAVNQNVEANNLYLRSIFDANLEMGTDRYFTLEEVIPLVPANRRRIGFRVRFLSSSGFYSELTFIGDSLDYWNDMKCWGHGNGNIIDGGEF